jgi:hypothetical protein
VWKKYSQNITMLLVSRTVKANALVDVR